MRESNSGMRGQDNGGRSVGTAFGPAAAMLAGAVCLVYSNTLGGSFHLDDFPFLVNNPAVRNFDVTAAMASFPSRALPMGWLTLDAWLGNFSLPFFHISAILLHCLNAILVYAFARRLLSLFRPQAGEAVIAASALAGALLFALHPLQTQPVNYICQRGVLLCAFFYTGALLSHIEYRITTSRIYLYAALLCGLMALFSKEVAYSLPGAIFLLDILAFRRSFAGALKTAICFALLAIVPLLLLTHSETYKDIDKLGAQGAAPVWQYLLAQPRSLLIYLRLLVLPVDQHLLYDLPPILRMGQAWPYLLGLCALVCGYAAFFRRNRAALLLGGLFFIFLSVESSFVPLQDVIFEHRMYLPLLAVSVGAAFGFSYIGKRRVLLAVALLFGIVLGAVSMSRNGVWHSEITLLEDNLQKAPDSAPVANNLGMAYIYAGRANEAKALFEKAIAVNPRFGPALNNLGYLLHAQGDRAGAEALFLRAMEDNAYAGEAAINVGNCALEVGDHARAESYFLLAAKISPLNINARMNLGLVKTLSGDYAGAREAYSAALRIDPRNHAAHAAAGRACYLAADYACAAEQAAAALSLFPENAAYRYALGMALVKQGRKAEGEKQLAVLRQAGAKLPDRETPTWK